MQKTLAAASSNEELTNNIKKKHSSCQHIVKYGKDSEQSRNKLQEKVNLFFLCKT